MTTYTLFATCPRGLETILAQELQQQGCTAVTPTDGGVSCQGTMVHVYSANLHSRTASRILLQLTRTAANILHELRAAVEDLQLKYGLGDVVNPADRWMAGGFDPEEAERANELK